MNAPRATLFLSIVFLLSSTLGFAAPCIDLSGTYSKVEEISSNQESETYEAGEVLIEISQVGCESVTLRSPDSEDDITENLYVRTDGIRRLEETLNVLPEDDDGLILQSYVTGNFTTTDLKIDMDLMGNHERTLFGFLKFSLDKNGDLIIYGEWTDTASGEKTASTVRAVRIR